MGTSNAVEAPISMARKHAASAETLWLTCSLLFKDQRARLTRVFGDFGVAGGDHYAIDALGLAKRGQRLPVEHASQRFSLLNAKKSR